MLQKLMKGFKRKQFENFSKKIFMSFVLCFFSFSFSLFSLLSF